jgi:hypothetical protein
MNNKIDDALKTLPDGLTWGQAMDLVGQSVLKPLLWVSGKISCNDEMTDADRYRLADIISKQTSPKEGNNTMTDEAPNPLLDADQRQYLLAAAKHRSRLAQSDTEDLFSIARRLRTQIEAARAADAKKPATDAAPFDASAHRAGWRDGTQWRHDRRKRRTTEEFDPEGRQQATYVSTSEEEDDPEKSLSDARNAYLQYVGNAYKQGK